MTKAQSLKTISFGFAQTPERLTDINAATISPEPAHLKVYDDKVMFFAKVPSSSINQLRKTDVTNAGSAKVITSFDYPHTSREFATTLNGIHYYQSGSRLIKTDGTEAGTSVDLIFFF
jgi:hypothetical protein